MDRSVSSIGETQKLLPLSRMPVGPSSGDPTGETVEYLLLKVPGTGDDVADCWGNEEVDPLGKAGKPFAFWSTSEGSAEAETLSISPGVGLFPTVRRDRLKGPLDHILMICRVTESVRLFQIEDLRRLCDTLDIEEEEDEMKENPPTPPQKGSLTHTLFCLPRDSKSVTGQLNKREIQGSRSFFYLAPSTFQIVG